MTGARFLAELRLDRYEDPPETRQIEQTDLRNVHVFGRFFVRTDHIQELATVKLKPYLVAAEIQAKID